MAFCSECGYKVKNGTKFCPECGSPIENTNESGAHRKEVYHGEVHKCPSCGEILKTFESVCPACGYEIRGVKSSSTVKEFSRILNQIEAERKPKTKLSGMAKKIGLGKPDVTDEKIVNHIRTFAVPNTKEDVFEFMILASSNIDMRALSATSYTDAGVNDEEEFNALKARTEAWIAKVEQTYEKAKLSFGSDPDFARIQNIYDQATGKVREAKKKGSFKKIVPFIGLAAMLVLCISFFASKGISHNMKEAKFEKTVQEIQTDIQNGDYDSALIKANTLHMDDNWSDESEEHWDQQREALIQMIEEAKEAGN